MKKIVALGAAAALVGGLFAAEPASNPSVVSFTGNASVEWGVDLDAGKTGFKNGTWTETKIKLFDAGDKATSGDGVWAELVMKIDDQDSCGFNGWQDGKWKSGNNAYIDVAKFHFNNFYVGIKSGDTQVGVLDFNTAVRSGDPWYHPGRWLKDVGPEKYTQGIVAGYEDGNFNFGIDFRSLEDASTQYTNSYAIAAEGKLKDSNEFVEGLSFGAGVAYNLSDEYYTSKAKDVGGEVVKTEANPAGHAHELAYSASVGYKFKIDDKYYVKPQVGLTGEVFTATAEKSSSTSNSNVIAAAVLFGWGDTNSYGNTGTLYYFDDDWGDKAKGLTPGLSAVAYIPLASTSTSTNEIAGKTYTTKSTSHDALKALIVPSVYSGDLIENLKFAAYSEIGMFEYKDSADRSKSETSGETTTVETWGVTADGKNTSANAAVAGLRYDIKLDDITVTPKASFRYANSCYVANKASIDAVVPASDKTIFPVADLGIQSKETKGERAGLLSGDFFNLEAGVEIGGLINNSTFYAHYKSANLLNNTDYASEKIDDVANPTYAKYGMYNVKLGTFNVGAKISF